MVLLTETCMALTEGMVVSPVVELHSFLSNSVHHQPLTVFQILFILEEKHNVQ